MNIYEDYLKKAMEYKEIVEIQLATFGEMHAPPHLFLQLENVKQAIEATQLARDGKISEDEWQKKVRYLLPDLKPVDQILQENLQDYFQKPITQLNEDTRQMWQKTILYAQYGFLVRMIMSIAVFLVGLLLFAVSSWQMLFGSLNTEQLLGPGVSFISGLSVMIAVIYSGPLKEIRASVDDLGVASAAFIAYVHRILEISHTFTYYYLRNQISFEEVVKSNNLIDEAMNSTIGKFHNRDSISIKKENILASKATLVQEKAG